MSTPSERFVEIGRTIGLAIAKVVEIGARVITWMVRFRTGVVKAGTTLARFFMPVWLALKDAVVEFGTTVMGVFRELGFFENGVGSTGDVLEWLGTQISGLIVVALVPLSIMFTALVKTATKVWKAIGFVIRVFKGLWAAGVVVVSFFKTTVPNAFQVRGRSYQVVLPAGHRHDRQDDRPHQQRHRERAQLRRYLRPRRR